MCGMSFEERKKWSSVVGSRGVAVQMNRKKQLVKEDVRHLTGLFGN